MAEFFKTQMGKFPKISFTKTPVENMDLKQQPGLENLDKITFPDKPDKVIAFSKALFERDFKEVETIGNGKFVVKSYFYEPLKRKIAIKLIHIPHNRYDNDHDNKRRVVELVREITSFQTLASAPNVVNCYGVCIYEGQALICMELMGMSLRQVFEKIHKMKNLSTTDQDETMKTLTQSDMDTSTSAGSPMEVGTKPDAANMSIYEFPEEFLAHVAVALLDALVDCKKQNVIHRDIKPDNVLLNKNGEVKLCDFGEARILHDSLASTFAGTLCYWPPERFEPEKKKFDVRADIWSLGITLVEIVRGSVPFKDKNGKIPNNIILLQNLILSLDTKNLVEETFSKTTFSDETREFVELCLNRIETRPKYDGLKETNFYKRYGSVENEKRTKIVEKWIKLYDL